MLGLKQWWKLFLKRKPKKISKPKAVPARYSEALFSNPDLQSSLAKKGYVKGGQLLNREDIAFLQDAFQKLEKALDKPIGEAFWPSGRCENASIRNEARNALDSLLKERLASFFIEEKRDFVGGSFLAKPASEKSHLYPHQDSSHVDEQNSFSVYAWIPLVDTTFKNGTLHVIPGSHLLGNPQRSLNVPWAFDGMQELLLDYVIPINLKAGEVLFFDAATIHYSPANFSEKMRLAANFYIKPRQQPFLHYYRDEDTPEGELEVYKMTIDYFYNENFEERPDQERFPIWKREPLVNLNFSKQSLKLQLEELVKSNSNN